MRVKLYRYDVVNLMIFAVFIVGCADLLDRRELTPQVWWISWSVLALVLSFFGMALYRGFQQAERELTIKEQERIEGQDSLKKGQAILLSEFSKEQLQELLNRYIVKVGECEASEMPSHDVSVTKETLLMLIGGIRARLKEMEKKHSGFSVLIEE